jgi:hypothetical protein
MAQLVSVGAHFTQVFSSQIGVALGQSFAIRHSTHAPLAGSQTPSGQVAHTGAESSATPVSVGTCASVVAPLLQPIVRTTAIARAPSELIRTSCTAAFRRAKVTGVTSHGRETSVDAGWYSLLP